MEKIFENVTRITTEVEYELLKGYLEHLYQEAISGGYFDEPDSDNEHKREIGRLATLGGQYESEFKTYSFREANTPIEKTVKRKMLRRRISQREVVTWE
jgi:hypothetical protein